MRLQDLERGTFAISQDRTLEGTGVTQALTGSLVPVLSFAAKFLALTVNPLDVWKGAIDKA